MYRHKTLIDELIKSEKFKSEMKLKDLFVNEHEAAIYESTPGHYNTV